VAARYGESVYSISAVTVDQLSAMPSVHVGWAALVGWAVVTTSPSRYRWWVLAHPALTVFMVVATGNHFRLDGIVAGGLLAISIGAVRVLESLIAPRVDHGDASGGRRGHAGEGVGDPAERDPVGDELVWPQRA